MNNRIGPPSREPCDVCGGHDDNQMEPRFLYTVCHAHQRVAPVDINRAIDEIGQTVIADPRTTSRACLYVRDKETTDDQ